MFPRAHGCFMTNAAAASTVAEPAKIRPEWSRAGAEFGLLAAASAALFHAPLQSMASIWLTSSAYHHGLFAAPISIWLILRRKDWRNLSPIEDGLGVLILAAASTMLLFGRAAGADIVNHVALVIAIVGCVVCAFGRALAARWAFPLAFLFFMVPFGEELTPTLQHWASVVLAAALNLSGVETLRDGFMLTTVAGRFEVAASCAGLRFLLASAMISSLVAYLAFSDWRKRIAFIVLALTAAIFANWLRAYLIVMIATLTDRRLGIGPEHVMLGWIFYSVLILAMLAAVRRFADHGSNNGIARFVTTGPRKRSSKAVLLGLTAMSIAAVYDGVVVSAQTPPLALASISPFQSNEFAIVGRGESWHAHAPNADSIATYDYRSADNAVTVSIAYFTRDRQDAEIASADTRAADGVNWRRIAISVDTISLGGADHCVPIETLEDAAGRKLDVATLYWLGDHVYGSPAALKIEVAVRKLTGRPTEGGVIFVAAGPDANADPRAAIDRFFDAAEPFGAWRAAFNARN